MSLGCPRDRHGTDISTANGTHKAHAMPPLMRVSGPIQRISKSAPSLCACAQSEGATYKEISRSRGIT